MNTPKIIEPLLLDHIIGEPISDHDGVRCCPAMHVHTQDKYIVKILSIPASQVQLDALLLTGAYSDRESALTYFKELADSAVAEAELLQRLSGLEGFVGFKDWQVEPMADGVGYDVYLLSPYRPTLERYLAANPMTHLGAVNLGLDLCAALSVCRQSGYLYVALKPDNVYITEKGDYRIGDLGFIPMDSLKYASLPDKYRSNYTAPEIADAYSALNTTMDIYALGLILYQAYNNGKLPTKVDEEPMVPPAYADYEMAEIILKACADDPCDRWQTPAEMGQALVSYMQRNSVNDTPIVPPPTPDEPEAEESPDPEALPDEDTMVTVDEASANFDAVSDLVDEDEPDESADEESDELDQLEFPLTDETAPGADMAEEIPDTVVSQEVSEMLAQADDLIAHETPDPVIPPDPIEIPMPEPIADTPSNENSDVPTAEAETAPEEPQSEDTPIEEPAGESIEANEEALPAEDAIEDVYYAPPKEPKKHGGIIIALATVLILLLLAVAGMLYYDNYYIQSIQSLSLSGEEDYLTVQLDTNVDDDLLTVVCSDTYGNTRKAPVTNGVAYFTNLSSQTQYKITVEISGFHRLIGNTTDSYTTPSCTNIVSFNAITGAEDGSVILNFVVDGQDDSPWRVIYFTGSEQEIVKEFTGHMVTINGLAVGSTYKFRLESTATEYVTGADTLEHTASKVIYAENLVIQGFQNGVLNATWNAPEGVAVESWTVRCYNDSGYDKTFTVSEPSVSIAELDPASAYTIDVNAAGMSLGKRAFVSAGSVTINSLAFDDSTPGQLKITWTYEGAATADGWLVLYSLNGSEPQVIRAENGSAVIPQLIPGGQYAITVQPPQGATVFGGTGTYTAPGGQPFADYGTTAENITLRMCWTPNKVGWHWYELWEKDFTTEYAVGERASFVTHVTGDYIWSEDTVDVMFVIKNGVGNLLSIEHSSRPWSGVCTEGYGELDMPTMPTTPGAYAVDIYFNNGFVASQAFTIKG